MNNRQRELLKLLLLKEDLLIKQLSEELDCSEKTVRNDLDQLEEFLLDYPKADLIRKPGVGITLEISEEDRSTIFNSLLSCEPKSSEERVFEIAYVLLTSHKPIILQDLAHNYYVPKATIKKDMEIISEWLKDYHLELVSKPRLGTVLQGSELHKRNALAHLSQLIPTSDSEKNYVLDLFLPYEISTVRKSLEDMQEKFSFAFTDEAFTSLVVHALVMIKRTRQRATVFVQELEINKAREYKEYQYTVWLFTRLESAFGMTFPEEEHVYFTWHLISSKRMEEGLQTVYDKNVTKIVNGLMEKMEVLTQFPFSDDSILLNGLEVHLYSVINRIKFGFPITNPLLVNIKKMYPYMFSMVILALEEINQAFDLEIPEDEAAYIVLHFQASIERLDRKKMEKKSALIVCHLGTGISRLLQAKIEQRYQEITIVACIGKSEVQDFLRKSQVDFIISTIPLKNLNNPQLVISPLFGKEDKEKLSQFVERLNEHNQKGFDPYVLSTYLEEDSVFLQVELEHRYEIVEMLATHLYEKGYVSKEYIHSAVNRERKSSTAIGGGIAIPHGDPSMIKQSVVVTAVLKKPIKWGEELVSVVFLLAISKKNHQDIRKIMGTIAALSESPKLVFQLTASKDYKSFIQTLKKKSE
ncbi:MAG TPA: BglG family transcription antiterminator [Bacillaceae bacterium]|nr:BglG family transcription antiterminator [Bacillaceae bacterium]